MAKQSPGIYSDVFTFVDYTQDDPTTVAAIVGGAKQGPTNAPTIIYSVPELTRTFGNPIDSDFGLLAAVDFLNEGGGAVYYTRVASSTAKTATTNLQGNSGTAGISASSTLTISNAPADAATITLVDIEDTSQVFEFDYATAATTTITSAASAAATDGEKVTLIDNSASPVTAIFEFDTNSSVTSGNVAVAPGAGVTDSMANLTTAINAHLTLGITASFNATDKVITLTQDTAGTGGNQAVVETVSSFAETDFTGGTGAGVTGSNVDVNTDGTATAAASNFVTAVNASTTLNITAVLTGDGATGLDPVVTLTMDTFGINTATPALGGTTTGLAVTAFSGGAAAASGSDAPVLQVAASSPGTWGNALKVKIVTPSAVVNAGVGNYDLHVQAPVETGSTTYQTVEIYTNLSSTASDARYVQQLINKGQRGVTNKSAYVSVTATTTTAPNTQTTALGGSISGLDGLTDLLYSDYVGSASGTTSSGLKALRNDEKFKFDLLLVPGQTHRSVISEMISLAEARKDCLALIDPPLSGSPSEITDWHNGTSQLFSNAPTSQLDSAYAACYWSWTTRYNSFLNKSVTQPPSGLVGAAMARTDKAIGPFRAPAGFVYGSINADEVEFSPLQADRDTLQGNGNKVNPLVDYGSDGIKIMGNSTLQRAEGPMDAVHVTRMVLFLQKTIKSSVRALQFAPNEPDTWRECVAIVRPILEAVKAQKGLQAYSVKCDAETNPPAVRADKTLVCQIVLQHIDASETIQLDFALTPSSADFSVAGNTATGANSTSGGSTY
jgi:uncharacterized protein